MIPRWTGMAWYKAKRAIGIRHREAEERPESVGRLEDGRDGHTLLIMFSESKGEQPRDYVVGKRRRSPVLVEERLCMLEPFRTILCPVDFSDNSHMAVAYAAYLARQCGGVVHLLYVIPPVDAQIPAELYHSDTSGGADRHWAETAAKERLTALAHEHVGEGIPCEIHIRVGDADASVLAMAEAIEAKVMVMAAHGRTGLAHLLWGSVVEKVLHASLCPVLVIPGR
jgi:nucleotide-binding universal stress UspA family protein